MKINLEFVEKIGRQYGKKPCDDGLDWFKANFPDGAEHENVFKKAVEDGVFGYPAWALAFSMSREQAARWAIYCARSVLHIWEAAHPEDLRPRLAIEAAEAYLANPCEETRDAARGANVAARAAAHGADVARAARAAAWTADAAWAACAGHAEAWSVAWAVWAGNSAAAADPSISLDLLNEGYRIWQEEK